MKRSQLFLMTLGAVLIAGSVWAQQPAAGNEQEPATGDDDQQLATASDNDQQPDADAPGRPIKFRENPYDNGYYYGSQRGGYYGFFGYRQGFYGPADRYTGFSRRVPYGYSRFWTRGYGYPRVRRGPAFGYGRTIGENGDLFLFAPAILAPVGPLTGVFYDGR